LKTLLEKSTVENIPALTLYPAAAQRRPVVFFISGYGGTKEAGLSLGYRLAQRGFVCVSFDAWLHGERYDRRRDRAADPELGGVYPPETGLDIGVMFFRTIYHCLEDVQTLRAHFSDDPRMDVERCGVTGLSMGGYASFLVFANVGSVRAAVPMIGIPSFARRWRDLIDETSYSNPAWAAALAQIAAQTREHTAFIEAIDPYEKLQQAAPRALLIMNCDFDTDQPKLYALDAYRDLLASYRDCPEKLRLRIYPAGHTVTPQMEQDAVAWFERHLG
jgi:fermentation-respiration switch protein FrsA (DUF1100 family)